MHNDKTVERFRQIDMEDVNLICRVNNLKGVDILDYEIDENEESQKYCVIAIGDICIDTVEEITKDSNDYMFLMADISHRNLDEVNVGNKLYLMGNVEEQEMLTTNNRRALSKFVKSHKRIYVVTRLDNELNKCRVVEKMVQHLYRIKREVVLITIKPFLFELPPWRVELVNNTLKSFEKYIEKMIVFDSEDILKINEASILGTKECFRFLDHVIALIIRNEYDYGDKKVTYMQLDKIFYAQK